ncbi:MAG: riboflavin synthase subunit alpha [Gammaproteobacteria bacterium]|nr:riboflavin synthase subunit alpha [Gammaproteobacteria bacterium]
MFTGIVAAVCAVIRIDETGPAIGLNVELGSLSDGLVEGSSVSVNGVCLTASHIENGEATFFVVPATANLTNLESCNVGSRVNIERSLKFGSEIGGHVLSGHICDVVRVVDASNNGKEPAISFEVPEEWCRFLFPKGFIALNGVSLTLAEFDRNTNIGSVNLIPDTLERTNLGSVAPGDLLNLEVDSQTQSIVETTESFLRGNFEWIRSLLQS